MNRIAKEHDLTWHGWGHNYDVMHRSDDGSRYKFVGWLTPQPSNGDTLLIPMDSGKVCKFRVENIRYCGDPKDMFFCDGVPYAYVGDDRK